MGACDETKRTNEIGTVEALMDLIPDIRGKTVTADALLTQRKFARYLLDHGAHYMFIVKGNQKTLLEDVTLVFETAPEREPDFEEEASLAHGRIEQRTIRTTTELNDYLNFPGVGQAFMIERSRQDKKTGKIGTEIAYGLTTRPTAPTRRACSPLTGATGASRTPRTTAWTGPGTRTEAASAPASAPRT